MQNIFREFAWRMLCSIEIILNKIHKTLFFHQSATYWGHWSWPSRLFLAQQEGIFISWGLSLVYMVRLKGLLHVALFIIHYKM